MRRLALIVTLLFSGPAFGIVITPVPYEVTSAWQNVLRLSEPWVDVKAYGAVGDGETDDSTAIQAAIDAAAATCDAGDDGRAIVYFPQSEDGYACDADIDLKSNVILRGGRLNFSGTYGLKADSLNSWALENMTIVGSETADQVGLFVHDTTYRWRVTDCRFYDLETGIFITKAWNWSIDNCIYEHPDIADAVGIKISSGTGNCAEGTAYGTVNAGTIFNNYFTGVAQSPTVCGPSVWVGDSSLGSSSITNAKNIVILSNKFDAHYTDGVQIENCKGISVRDNYFERNTIPVDIEGDWNYSVRVETNDFYGNLNSVQMDPAIQISTTATSHNLDISIKDNQFDRVFRGSLAFTSGGTVVVEAGDTITGATSGATAVVASVDLDTGSWAGGDAAGTIYIDPGKTGTFEAENLDVGVDLNVATISADTEDTHYYVEAEDVTGMQLVLTKGGDGSGECDMDRISLTDVDGIYLANVFKNIYAIGDVTAFSRQLNVDGYIEVQGDLCGIAFRRDTSAVQTAYIEYDHANTQLEIGANAKDVVIKNLASYGDGVRFESDGKTTFPDSATTAIWSITERSDAPTSQATGDIYLDDGTNTASTNPGWRRYTGAAWEDVSAAGGYTNLTSYVDQTAWRFFYSDAAGDVKEVALGTDGQVLTSTGVDGAPGFEDAPGAAGGDAWGDAVDADIIPDTDDAYDLGDSTHEFTDGWFDGTLYADVLSIPEGALADAVIVDADIKDDTLQEPALNSTNAPTDNYVLSYNEAGTNFTWIAAAGGGDLLANGTIPLTADWDVGAYYITALRYISDVATGTSPLTVASTTLCSNLNADLLDGEEASAFEDADAAIVKSDEAETLTADWVNTDHPWADNEMADAHSHAADAIDAITEIAAALKSGSDTTLVTGTKGTDGQLGQWNSDGDLIGVSQNAGTDITADLEEDTHASEHAVSAADTVFPADPGEDKYLMWDDDPGALVWASGASGGDTWGDAVDADILPTGNDNTYDLGSEAASFADIWWDGTGHGNLTGTLTGNADTVTNATLTTALTVNTGTLTLTADAGNDSVVTIGGGASSLSGSNTGDNTVATSGDAAEDFFGENVSAVTDATVCTDLEGTKLSITGNTLNCTETDSVVGAVTGLVKADGGGNISAATANTDYEPALSDEDSLYSTLSDVSDFSQPTEIPGMTSTTPDIVFAFNIHDIDDTMDDIKLPFIRATTITKVIVFVTAGTNVVGRLYEVDGDGDDADAVGVEESDWTFTVGETEDSSFNNATFDAGDYIQWDTTSVSGSVTGFMICVYGYET